MKALRFAVLLAVAAVAIPGVAQAGEATPAQAVSLERLEAASSTPVSAEFADGAPRFVSANVPVAGASATERALTYLEAYRDLYGLSSPREQLQVVRVAGEGAEDDIFFGQSVRGVPVKDAQIAVHVRGDSVVATSGAYLPVLPAATKPVLSAEEATAVAQTAAGRSDDAVEPAELTYFNASLTMNGAERAAWDLDAATHVAWRVSLPTRESLVDARTGRELIGYDPVLHAATDLSVRTSLNGVQAPFCGWPGAIEWFDENDVRPGVMPTPDTEGRNAFDSANATYDYFRSKFGRLSFDGRDGQIELTLDVNVSAFGGSVNAGYDGHCHDLYFTNNMATRDIVAHEFTHAVTQFTAHLTLTNQQGALHEHYSDFFAAMIDPDWVIGEGSAAPVALRRNLSDPTTIGDPDNMGAFVFTTADNGGVHTNAGIPNKVAFLITDGGFHRGFQITGLGRSKTERLYYEVLTRRLPSNATFAVQRNHTVNLAAAWETTGAHGFTFPDACNVNNAFASVGLGDGDADCDGIGDSIEIETDDDNDGRLDGSDNCVSIANSSQLDTDSDGMGNPCDRDDDGDGRFDTSDNCALVSNPGQFDVDGDGIGDACDLTPNGDVDLDGVDDGRDNCKGVWNPDQGDADGDRIGNACDTHPDNDRDGVANGVDNCPGLPNPDQSDGDRDGRGDVCDNAPTVPNYDQADTDRDGVPDVLDPDDDNDGVLDGADNCPVTANPRQEDSNGNGMGDACEYILAPDHTVQEAFAARDAYFERFQILVDPCLPECGGPPGGLVRSTIHVDAEYQLELRLLDAGGEVVASGVSGEPLTFEFAIGEDGSAPQYRLDILPSREFEPGNEYPFTAEISRPDGA